MRFAYYLLAVTTVLGSSSCTGLTTPEARAVPYLGLSSRAPSADETQAFGLEFRVRYRGQVVESVEESSPAERAGIRAGDVVLKLGDNDVYSYDDIRDFVATSAPGREVKVALKRAGTAASETVPITVGERRVETAGSAPGIQWEFASLAQLDSALSSARAQKKRVLVGISGAET